MADGKWIDGLKATTPLEAAARKVLEARLGAVCARIRPALKDAGEDPEHVHQLRVATRRARAALDLFEECLPGKVYREVRKALRRIRRGAGPARDWDVFLHELEQHFKPASATRKIGLVFLMGHSQALRAQAQTGIQEQIGAIDLGDIEKHALAAIRANEDATLGELATPCLTRLLRELHDGAGRNLKQYDHLHEVRIIGKRLRYAMELFVGCYSSAFRTKFYPAIEEMQDILGRANDSYVASQRLAGIREEIQATRPSLWNKVKAGIEFLRRFHERQLVQERKSFDRWWSRWKKSGAEDAFAELLTGTNEKDHKTNVNGQQPSVTEAAEVAAESDRPEASAQAEAASSPGTESAATPHPQAPEAAASASPKAAEG